MEFVHYNGAAEDTIAAISTPPGEGGIAAIRISGKRAFEVGAKIFSGPFDTFISHTAHYGAIINGQKEKIDEVLILPMRGPRSYTGEDTVEVFCHGGSLITRRVLEVVLHAGARAAFPGEFTFRAFINGKIDLAQAEAVQELIGAKNERALEAAEVQLAGHLSQKVNDWQDRLALQAAILEAWVDFPEEGLEFSTLEEILEKLEIVRGEIAQLINSYHEGKKVHEGLSLCLAGAPNVGKSSLMNALLNKERAIVSPIPGTTRDVLEDELRLAGLHFRVLDTAGIRETEEWIEQEGIRRTKEAMGKADLVLLVLDAEKASEPLPFLSQVPRGKTILVWNKCDLPHGELPLYDFPHAVKVSALNREGLDRLKEEIDRVVWGAGGPPSKEEVVITHVRHKEALDEAEEALERVEKGLKRGVSPEFLSFDLRAALAALGKIIGTNISESILDKIFSTFCIGK
jgi:tRNA modification GTPase